MSLGIIHGRECIIKGSNALQPDDRPMIDGRGVAQFVPATQRAFTGETTPEAQQGITHTRPGCPRQEAHSSFTVTQTHCHAVYYKGEVMY